MVVTDQYMQKVEKELTEVRQSVGKIETAMQKFLSHSTETAKNAQAKKENEKKENKDSKGGDSLVAALKKLRDEGDKIGEQLGKAADNAVSKIGDAFAGFLKTGKLDFSDVIKTLKTDFRGVAITEAKSLLAGGVMKWLGVGESGKDKTAATGKQTGQDKQENPAKDDIFQSFFDGLTQSFRQFFEDGKTLIGDLAGFLKNIPGVGAIVGGAGSAVSGVGGLFSGLGKNIGQFFGIGGTAPEGNSAPANGMGSDAAEGMKQVAEAGKQSANDMAEAMQGAMQRTENVLTRFVETGKFSFKELTRSILADIAQIMLKMAMSKLIGSLFGGASASAAGGYDIPAGENPVTRLHEKEMVLPAQYANVIRGLAGNGSAAGSGGININTSISVSGDGNVNQQSDGGNSSQRQLADMINNQTRAIIAREMRQGGLIWNMRMGVA